jgi:hypothetical protein
MTSTFPNWTWKEYKWVGGDPETVSKSGTVTGDPFYSHSQSIEPLQPGQSAKYQIWLTQRQVWFEPDGWNDHYAQQYAEWDGQYNHGWVLLQKGATVEGTITSSCTTDFGVKIVLSGQASG